jgi:hypothetical protein
MYEQLEYTKSFVEGTGFNAPAEVIARGLKSIQDWSDHLEKHNRLASIIPSSSERHVERKVRARHKREIRDADVLRTIRFLNTKLSRACTAREIVEAMGGVYEPNNFSTFVKSVKTSLEELLADNLIYLARRSTKHNNFFMARSDGERI